MGHIQINFKSMHFLCHAPRATHPPTAHNLQPTGGPTRASDLWSLGRTPRRGVLGFGAWSRQWSGTSRPCLSVNKMYVFVGLRSSRLLPRPPPPPHGTQDDCAYITRPLLSIFMRFPGVDLLRLMLLSAQCARACPGCQWGINSWFHALLIDGKGCAKIPPNRVKKGHISWTIWIIYNKKLYQLIIVILSKQKKKNIF